MFSTYIFPKKENAKNMFRVIPVNFFQKICDTPNNELKKNKKTDER